MGEHPKQRIMKEKHEEEKDETAEAQIENREQDSQEQQKTVEVTTQEKDIKECQKTESTPEDTENQGLSKNKIRKRRRQEKLKALNAQRKQQKKEARYAKALAEGRDIEQEKREQERRTQSGEGNKKRLLAEKQRFENADKSFGVCLDCSYESQMTDKEISSLALQIRYCYGVNKRSKNPCRLFISSLSGKTYDHLCKVNGFPEQWKERAFINTEKHFNSYWKDNEDSKKLVYLTSDSDNVIETLEDDKIYIIGGIVDRNRLKEAALTQAQQYSIPTAKLPISNYIKTNATKVLTCNHVFEILLKYKEHGQDWEKALMDVLPQRKGLSTVKADDEVQKQKNLKNDDDKNIANSETKDPSCQNGSDTFESK